MKKSLILLFVLLFAFGLVACDSGVDIDMEFPHITLKYVEGANSYNLPMFLDRRIEKIPVVFAIDKDYPRDKAIYDDNVTFERFEGSNLDKYSITSSFVLTCSPNSDLALSGIFLCYFYLNIHCNYAAESGTQDKITKIYIKMNNEDYELPVDISLIFDDAFDTVDAAPLFSVAEITLSPFYDGEKGEIAHLYYNFYHPFWDAYEGVEILDMYFYKGLFDITKIDYAIYRYANDREEKTTGSFAEENINLDEKKTSLELKLTLSREGGADDIYFTSDLLIIEYRRKSDDRICKAILNVMMFAEEKNFAIAADAI